MLEISDTGNTTFARENLLLLNLSADEPLNLISEGFPRYFVNLLTLNWIILVNVRYSF